MRISGKSLADLRGDLEMYPQELINVPIAEKVNLDDHPAIQKSVKGAEDALGDSGRVLLRPSGTEPLVRVMVEGSDAAQVNQICNQVAGDVKKALE